MRVLFNKLATPISNSTLILFRIFLGLLIFAESIGAIFTGWVDRVIVKPTYRFTFIDFGYLENLQGEWMYLYFIIMGVLGLCIAFGLYYKVTMPLYTIMWAGIYFSQKSSYNNHYYLLLLVAAVMSFLPANSRWSLDVKLGNTKESKLMPYGIKLFFIVQMFIVYTYASVAKVYPDWLSGKTMEVMFSYKKDYPLVGSFLQYKPIHFVFAYVGILFDLLVSPLLAMKKTRKYIFIVAIIFHLTNSYIFRIGIFPFFALAISIFFFDSEWFEKRVFKNNACNDVSNLKERVRFRPILAYLAIFYLVIQFCLPLRHWFIPGNVLITEEGHRLSWRMMLRVKSGSLGYSVRDSEGKFKEYISPSKYFSNKQCRSMKGRPDMIWQGAQKIYTDLKSSKYKNQEISIHATSYVKINGRKNAVELVDEDVNLAKENWNHFSHNEWILSESLKD